MFNCPAQSVSVPRSRSQPRAVSQHHLYPARDHADRLTRNDVWDVGNQVLGSVFFKAYSVMFDLSGSSPTVPPTIGLGKINPKYDVLGISDWNSNTAGSDGGNVHRVFVSHAKTKLFHKPDEVRRGWRGRCSFVVLF